LAGTKGGAVAKKKIEEDDENSVLDRAVSEIRKKWGADSIYVPGEELEIDKEVMATGIPPLDDILGNGGIVKGSIIEIFGEEGSGKSTLCLQMIAQAQKMGIVTAFIDQEQALDTAYAEAVGADISKVYISQPESMEMALGIVESLVRTGEVGLVIVDSLASLVPEAELRMTVQEQGMGLQSKKMSEWLRRFNPTVSNTNTILIFTNQLREKIGSMYGGKVTPGGKALKFYASYRIEVRVVQKIKDSAGVIVGNELEITTKKNKKAAPYQSTRVRLNFGEGVDIVDAMVDDAVELGLIEKSGNWFVLHSSMGGEKFNGKGQLKEFLISKPDLLSQISSDVASFKCGVDY
jgi:recombination protein RecA